MAFKFSLQAVLEHRIAQEEKAQRAFGDVMRRMEFLREKKSAVDAMIARREEDVRRRQRSGMSFAQRQIYELWIEGQHLEAQQLDQWIDKMAVEVELRRQALVCALQARITMERLREGEIKNYRYQESRAERKTFDDIAARDYIRGRRREKDAQKWERIAR